MSLPPARLGAFAVHLSCGTVRGDTFAGRQTCPCESAQGARCGLPDRIVDLCAVCARGVAWSATSWSYYVCQDCKTVEMYLRERLGRDVLPIGRQREMNGHAGGGRGGSRESVQPYLAALVDLLPVAADLPAHGRRVAQEMARDYPSHLDQVPLETWCSRFPSALHHSIAQYEHLMRMPLPGWAKAQIEENEALRRASVAQPASASWSRPCEETVRAAGRATRCRLTAQLEVRRGPDGLRTALCTEHLVHHLGEQGDAVVRRAGRVEA